MLKNMPLFNKRSSKKEPDTVPVMAAEVNGHNGDLVDNGHPRWAGELQGANRSPTSPPRPPLVFHCQQAHGSPTGLICGFSTVRELYQKISECYDFPPDDVSMSGPLDCDHDS